MNQLALATTVKNTVTVKNSVTVKNTVTVKNSLTVKNIVCGWWIDRTPPGNHFYLRQLLRSLHTEEL